MLKRKMVQWLMLCSVFCFLLPVNYAAGELPSATTWNFETGNLQGWIKVGNAFNAQPTYGDNPTARHRGQPSNHEGRYWIGSYEKYQGLPGQKPGDIQGDGPYRYTSFAKFYDSIRYAEFFGGRRKQLQNESRVDCIGAARSPRLR